MMLKDLCTEVFRRINLQCWKMNWDSLGQALAWMLNCKDENLGFSAHFMHRNKRNQPKPLLYNPQVLLLVISSGTYSRFEKI